MQLICTKEISLSWNRRESSTWAEVDPQGHLFLWETFSLPSLVPRTWREELLVLKFPRGAHLHSCVIDQRQNDSNTRKKMTSLVSSASDSVAIAPLDRKIGRSASCFFQFVEMIVAPIIKADHSLAHVIGGTASSFEVFGWFWLLSSSLKRRDEKPDWNISPPIRARSTGRVEAEVKSQDSDVRENISKSSFLVKNTF